MKRVLILFALAGALAGAQSLSVTVSPAQVWPGQSVTATIAFSDSSPSSGIAAFGGTVATTPTTLTPGTLALGAAATAAVKAITVNGAAFILAGSSTLNDTVIGSGALLTVPIAIPASTKPQSATVSVSSRAAATSAGGPVTLTATSGAFSICSVYAITGDCTAAIADVLAMISDALHGTCTGQAANVGDGKCGLDDVELEIEAALGKIS